MGKINQIELREQLDEIKENFELQCDIYREISKQLRVIFECLVDEGFSESQALEIVKERGTSLH